MKEKYVKYKAIQFSTDPLFLRWRLFDDQEASLFWLAFLEEHPEKRQEVERAMEILASLQANKAAFTVGEKQKIWSRVNKSLHQRRRKGVAMWAASVAAVVAVLLSLVFFFSGREEVKPSAGLAALQAQVRDQKIQLVLGGERVVEFDKNTDLAYDTPGQITVREKGEIRVVDTLQGEDAPPLNQLIVPGGKRSSIVLPDGSCLWVNAGTTVEFPSRFAPDRRDVRVNGEVYIEVVPDVQRPFYLHTSRFSVNVIGTKFNVMAYEGDESHSVVLVEGAVRVALLEQESIDIQPEEMFLLAGEEYRVEQVDIADYTSWKEGMLFFTGQSLNQVLSSLSRYYGVAIEGEETEDILITGKLVLFDDLELVLDNIAVITPVTCKVENDRIRMIRKK